MNPAQFPFRGTSPAPLRNVIVLLAALLLIAAGCAEDAEKDKEDSGGSGGDGGTAQTLPIVGDYEDEFLSTHQITEETWTQSGFFGDSVFTITAFDNDAQFLVAQNGADNEYNPDLWSRFDWVYDGDHLYFCQIAYGEETEEAAAALDTADEDDLLGGCNGFGWSLLTPVVL